MAFVLRVWGLGFGLPHTRAQPDESRLAGTAVGMLRGELHPGFFNYPTLFMYAEAASYTGYCAAGRLAGRFAGLQACAASWPTHWEPFFLLGRLLSALTGAAALFPVFFLARRIGESEGNDAFAGVIASACLAVAWLHVRDSHFGVTDVAMTTLTLIGVVLVIRAHERPSLRRFALAGLVSGLAASTKYNAALLVAAILVSQAAALVARPRRLDARAPVFALCLLAGFAAGSPYAVLDRARFVVDVSYEASHLASGHGVATARGWSHHALVTLPLGVGWPLLLSGCAGAIVALRRRPVPAAVVFAFPVVYYGVAGRGLTVFARYMVPIVPFVCIGAGAFASYVRGWTSRAAGARAALLVTGAVVAACIVPNAWKSARLDRLLARPDSRVLATEWITSHVTAGQTVYVSGSEWGRPDLWLRGAPRSFAVMTDDDHPLRGGRRPDWVVVEQSPLTLYNGEVSDSDPALREYDLKGEVLAYNPAVPHVFDVQDAFFLPLDGFRGVARPGPNFLFYEYRRGG